MVSCAQVTVTLQVEQSRRACDAVAHGEADCAIIGGDVPEDLASVLQVITSPLAVYFAHPKGSAIKREENIGAAVMLHLLVP